ncbi:MAG: LemA family protein [Deltaproteobacteria bacterium]|nr:LemA family protein [Deltaproteobacteria bacterium]
MYGPPVAPRPAVARSPARLRRVPWLQRLKRYYEESPRRVWVGLAVASGLLVLGLTVRYYNRLVVDHTDALAARAKVDALIQRRSDLARTLEQVIIAHARHEAGVFGTVADKRVALGGATSGASAGAGAGLGAGAGAGAAAPAAPMYPADVASLPAQLGRLLAIAEQYPQLRLSDSFQVVTRALVDVEKDLDQTRRLSVDAANRYVHHLDTFPGNFFGLVFGFKKLPYFEADAAAKQFTPVRY